MNLRIQEAREDIANAVNEAKLPPGVLLVIINEFAGQIQMQNLRAIETEKKVLKGKESE